MTADEITTAMVSVFGATDGGVDLVRFRFKLNDLEKLAEAGDQPAKELMLIAERMVRFVNVMIQ